MHLRRVNRYVCAHVCARVVQHHLMPSTYQAIASRTCDVLLKRRESVRSASASVALGACVVPRGLSPKQTLRFVGSVLASPMH